MWPMARGKILIRKKGILTAFPEKNKGKKAEKSSFASQLLCRAEGRGKDKEKKEIEMWKGGTEGEKVDKVKYHVKKKTVKMGGRRDPYQIRPQVSPSHRKVEKNTKTENLEWSPHCALTAFLLAPSGGERICGGSRRIFRILFFLLPPFSRTVFKFRKKRGRGKTAGG